jgi:hypothetical protein
VNEVITDAQLRDYRGFFDELTTRDGRTIQVPGRPWASGPRVLTEQLPRRRDIATAWAPAGAAPSATATISTGGPDA